MKFTIHLYLDYSYGFVLATLMLEGFYVLEFVDLMILKDNQMPVLDHTKIYKSVICHNETACFCFCQQMIIIVEL